MKIRPSLGGALSDRTVPWFSPGGQSSSTCRCGAWLRSDLTGSTRCPKSEARTNRHGTPIGGRVCDGQTHPGDRVLLLATICDVENIVVGLVRSWGGEIPWIAGCQLCEWCPNKPEDADIHTLMGHLDERHKIPGEAVQRVGPQPPSRNESSAA